ncbi:unnamed protein product [Psylliodes chrysocephalus]|uniref:Uncharacterized protein n=1 Tax=Psylliodes chrysocephalus TaxID=3402493 RepID=A0A9P0CSW5_9CUCU|nr:unnamed protein product [Psylliodes chrysocephala]
MSNNPSNVISDIGSTSLVVKSLKLGSKLTPNKFKCSQSENKLKIASKGIKEKIVSKVRSWSSRDKFQLNDNTDVDTRLLKGQKGEDIENESMENIADSNLTRARGSLENLLKDDLTTNDDFKSRSTSATGGTVQKNVPESPKSSPDTSKGAAKHLIWDPFDKKGRKNRKEQGRKKKNKKHNMEQPKQECSTMPVEGKSCLVKPPEEKENTDETETVEEEYTTYKYKYFPKNSKSVVFTNEVFVVYFNDNDVYESKEPLKKDVEQQERNKEMRQGHLLRTQEKYNLCLY